MTRSPIPVSSFAQKETPMDNKLVLIIIAIIFPPVAVFVKKGIGMDLLVNIVLCILLFLPGLVHALWVISKS
jgi:uncharacterized membrane protein YqaE (UPF0057 family)